MRSYESTGFAVFWLLLRAGAATDPGAGNDDEEDERWPREVTRCVMQAIVSSKPSFEATVPWCRCCRTSWRKDARLQAASSGANLSMTSRPQLRSAQAF